MGRHAGEPVIVLGAAPGLDAHPELSALAGRVVIGTNWTLELLEPTYLQIVDAAVWNHQHTRISASSTVVLATTGIFGHGSFYSGKSPNVARQLGQNAPHIVHFRIQTPIGRGYRDQATGFFHRPADPPRLVASPDEPFHFGGNSVCYALQWAHLMGASAVYLMGFTMQSGSGYFFMQGKPTKASGVYEVDRANAFLRLVQEQRPGWVQLVDGWSGPIYDLLPSTTLAKAFKPPKPVKVKGAAATPW